jgi:hypothetical protein
MPARFQFVIDWKDMSCLPFLGGCPGSRPASRAFSGRLVVYD